MMSLRESVNRDRRQEASSLGQQAMDAAQNGRLDEATELFRLAARSDPENADWPSSLAIAQIRSGRMGDAGLSLQAAIILAPDRPDPWAHLGLLRFQTMVGGDAPLRRAAALSPLQPFYRLWRGDGLSRHGKPDEARDVLKAGCAVDPGLAGTWAALANSLIALQGGAGALPAATAATRLEPASPLYWSILGGARQAAGDIEGALADCRRAIVLQPGFADALGSLAILETVLGNMAAAD